LLVEIEKQMEREEPESMEVTSDPDPVSMEKNEGDAERGDKEVKAEPQDNQGGGAVDTLAEPKVLK